MVVPYRFPYRPPEEGYRRFILQDGTVLDIPEESPVLDVTPHEACRRYLKVEIPPSWGV